MPEDFAMRNSSLIDSADAEPPDFSPYTGCHGCGHTSKDLAARAARIKEVYDTYPDPEMAEQKLQEYLDSLDE